MKENETAEKSISKGEDKNKQDQPENNITLTNNDAADAIDFSKLENFLHPKSGSLRRLIEERVIKHPKILSEMLAVNFSDLVAVFQDLFRQNADKVKTIDEVYIELLDLVDEEGSEGIKRYAASLYNGQYK